MLKECESSEWKIRIENISKIINMIKNYPKEMTQYRMSSKAMDAISRQINDPNIKVALNALNLFK